MPAVTFRGSTLSLSLACFLVAMKRQAATSDAEPSKSTQFLVVSKPCSREEILLKRLRQNLLYFKLRSLIPGTTNFLQPSEIQTNLDEIPENEASDDEKSLEASMKAEENEMRRVNGHDDDDGDGDGGDSHDENEDSDHDENEAKHEAFKPSIKVTKMENTLLISMVALKKVALASDLFALLEKEKLDIAFEHQYRTKSKACYTFQVRVPAQLDVEALKEKIGAWADGKNP